MTPAVAVHGVGFAEPLSNPGFPSNCCVELSPLPTVRLIVTGCVWLPPVPLTTRLYVPNGVPAPAVIVKTEEPEPGAVIDDGLKFAVAPDGNPETERATLELNGPERFDVITEVPELP